MNQFPRLANNKEAMKQENQRQVLSLIDRHPISRSGLAKETGLTQSAISSIINNLISDNIVAEIGKYDDTSLGRKPTLLDINASWGYIIGISIDREGFDIGIVNVKGNVIGKATHLNYDDDVSNALDNITRETESLIAKNQINPDRIIGIGVIAPGPVDAVSGKILNPRALDSWHYLNLRDELQKRLPYQTYVQHNSNALARAEYRMGLGSKYNSFALFVVNSGIGLGLSLNRQIYTGANGLGCEIGHTSIDINGRLCCCGNRGCLELYASTAAILYEAGRVRKDITTWQDLIDKAYEGDTFCDSLLDIQARYLAHSIINLNNLLELDAVIITGMASYLGELLLEKIRVHVCQSVMSKSTRSLVIENSSIRENAMVIAAGAVVNDKLFNGNLYVNTLKNATPIDNANQKG